MEYPDQKLFEPEPDGEVEEAVKPFIPGWARLLGTTLAIIGLIYLSGVHQGFLFRRTPPSAERPIIVSELNEKVITLPLQVFVLVGGENLGSLRTEEDVDQMVRNASSIWNQADINLVVESTRYLELSDREISDFLESPQLSIPNVSGYNPKQINVFLTRTLNGINGVAFGGLRSTAVADFTTINDFRTFAHEIGHVLGLGHTQDRARLMAQGTNGSILTEEEISTAREIATEAGYE